MLEGTQQCPRSLGDTDLTPQQQREGQGAGGSSGCLLLGLFHG